MWAFRRSSNPPCWPVFGSSWSQVRGWFAVEGLAGFWRRTWRTLQIDLQLLMVGQLITGGGRWSLCTGLVASWPGWPVCSLTAHNSSLTAGDNKSTAESVGRQVGLLQGGPPPSPGGGAGGGVPGSSSPSLSGGWRLVGLSLAAGRCRAGVMGRWHWHARQQQPLAVRWVVGRVGSIHAPCRIRYGKAVAAPASCALFPAPFLLLAAPQLPCPVPHPPAGVGFDELSLPDAHVPASFLRHLSHKRPLPTLFPAGVEFDDLAPPQQADAVAGALAVFARVEPSHKTRLVELLKQQVGSGCKLHWRGLLWIECGWPLHTFAVLLPTRHLLPALLSALPQGQVAAMTGDGVNDAPFSSPLPGTAMKHLLLPAPVFAAAGPGRWP